MKSVTLNKSLASVALSVLFAGSLGLSCSKDEGGGGGGEGGGGEGGGDEGGNGGSDASGGKGGTAGGSPGGSGGKGGSGGSGGGMGGQVPTTKCGPGSTNMGGILGPASGWGGPNVPGTPPTFQKITVQEPNEGAMRPGAFLYIPAQYEAAAAGKVAVMFASPTMAEPGFLFIVEKMMAAEMMPPTIVVAGGVGIDWSGGTQNEQDAKTRANKLVTLLDELKVKYPKISPDSKMHALTGQSTAGALAFDWAWARPDVFGKVLGASASFASFQRWLFPYPQKVNESNKDKLRVALQVGECDFVWEPSLIPPACSKVCENRACICEGCDTANWLQFNVDTTKKLLDLGYKAQLLIKKGGRHQNFSEGSPDGLAFLWRDVACPSN